MFNIPKNLDVQSKALVPPSESGSIQRIVFVNQSTAPAYRDIPFGGWSIPDDGKIEISDAIREAWIHTSLDDGKPALLSETISVSVVGLSVQTRRAMVITDDGSIVGHVDILPAYWREIEGSEFANSLCHVNRQGKTEKPTSGRSLFLVLREQPDRVWEARLKSGAANALFGVSSQLQWLAEAQTKAFNAALAAEGGETFRNTLNVCCSWVTLGPGVQLSYGGEGGFTSPAIRWPFVTGRYSEFLRPFVKTDSFGEKVAWQAELSAAKKRLSSQDLEAMFVGDDYASLFEKSGAVDDLLRGGYIKPLADESSIREEMEAIRARAAEKSSRANRSTSKSIPAPALDAFVNSVKTSASKGEERELVLGTGPIVWTSGQLRAAAKKFVSESASYTEEQRWQAIGRITAQFDHRLGQHAGGCMLFEGKAPVDIGRILARLTELANLVDGNDSILLRDVANREYKTRFGANMPYQPNLGGIREALARCAEHDEINSVEEVTF